MDGRQHPLHSCAEAPPQLVAWALLPEDPPPNLSCATARALRQCEAVVAVLMTVIITLGLTRRDHAIARALLSLIRHDEIARALLSLIRHEEIARALLSQTLHDEIARAPLDWTHPDHAIARAPLDWTHQDRAINLALLDVSCCFVLLLLIHFAQISKEVVYYGQ